LAHIPLVRTEREGDEEPSAFDAPTSTERGCHSMPLDQLLLAYFGPEVQLPLTSLIGAISGVILIVGDAPIRWVRRRLTTLARFKGSQER
jgi:hypothetical protein